MRSAPWWRVLRLVLFGAAAALAILVVSGHVSELSGATGRLTHLRWTWVVIAAAAELASLLAYAIVQQRVLFAGQLRVPLAALCGVTLASQAISNSFPGGPALGAVFTFRQYHRRGADDVLAAWALAALLVTISVSLAIVAATGVAIAGGQSSNLDLVGVTVGVLVVAVGMAVLFVQQRALLWVLEHGIDLLAPILRRFVATERLAEGVVRRLTVVSLSVRQVLGALFWGLVNWILDCGCLLISFLAVGAPVPWKGLLLAYGAAQLAANLPITPGGLGVVEGSLTIALVAFGGGQVSTVAAVLLYRILSFWAELPLGWGVWLYLARQGRRRDATHHLRLTAAAAVGTPELAGAEAGEAGGHIGDAE